MGPAQISVLVVSLFYLFIFASGFWLSLSPKPFNGLAMTMHKLGSLAVLAFQIYLIVHIHRVTHFSGLEWAVCAAVGLSFLASIVSGGVVTAVQPVPAASILAHRIAPFAAVITTAAAFCLFILR
jgi:hypothetical protein